MMKQFFILGRNPQLSKEEIIAYANARDIKIKLLFFKEYLMIIETNQKIDIQKLGGTIRSGLIEFEGKNPEFEEYLKKDEIIPADKFTYSVFGNIEPDVLKEKFKNERKKAMLKHGRKKLKLQEGEYFSIPNTDFEIFFHNVNKKIYFGIIDQVFDNSGLKKRDMDKPIRREELAISPRLSRILINLSEAKENSNLLDPFCGIGAILLEALSLGINVYGIDKDNEAINSARKNLDWLKNNFNIKNRYSTKNMNSIDAPDFQFDAVATETPLGELQTKKPDKKEAARLIIEFTEKIIPVLRRIKKIKKTSAKIAITFPVIDNNRVDANEVAKACDLKIILQPIKEFREKQFISREILVFQ
jgi:tRNA G10  N-methylase Trm11